MKCVYALRTGRHKRQADITLFVCATSKGLDQPAHTRRLIRAFAGRLNIL